ncbi:MAG: methyltransferase domain-containing protein [Treponemataceae bacterium]
MEPSTTAAINIRYSELADTSCCLSCGGAINYSQPIEGEVCVDLGSGRGTDVIRMAEMVGPKGFVYGIDMSDGMVSKARKNLEKFDVTNAEILQASLEALPLESGSVDLVISNCTINHAENKEKVWSEIHRVLRSGGRFVVSDIYSMEEVPAAYHADPQVVAECWAGSVTRERYLDQVRGAGLDQIKIADESAPYAKGKIQVASWTVMGRRPDTVRCRCQR